MAGCDHDKLLWRDGPWVFLSLASLAEEGAAVSVRRRAAPRQVPQPHHTPQSLPEAGVGVRVWVIAVRMLQGAWTPMSLFKCHLPGSMVGPTQPHLASASGFLSLLRGCGGNCSPSERSDRFLSLNPLCSHIYPGCPL